MIELETSTLLWLIGGYCAIFVAWSKMAFKFRRLYNKKLSNFIFQALNMCLVTSMAMYCFYTSYVTNLQKALYKNTEAINAVLSLAASYDKFFYITWLALAALFMAWLLIALFLLMYEQDLRENNKE